MPRKRDKKGAQERVLPPYRPKTGGAPVLVTILADATKTSDLVMAALRGAYGWNEHTALTKAEFVAKRDAWLRQPANEV